MYAQFLLKFYVTCPEINNKFNKWPRYPWPSIILNNKFFINKKSLC